MKTAWRRNVVNTSLADISGSGLVCNTALLPVTRSHGGELPVMQFVPLLHSLTTSRMIYLKKILIMKG